MKRRDLLRRLVELGAIYVRDDGPHTVYRNPRTGRIITVPRHVEVNEITARAILREASR